MRDQAARPPEKTETRNASQFVVENQCRRLEEILVGEHGHHRDRVAKRLFGSRRGNDDDFVICGDFRILLLLFDRLYRLRKPLAPEFGRSTVEATAETPASRETTYRKLGLRL